MVRARSHIKKHTSNNAYPAVCRTPCTCVCCVKVMDAITAYRISYSRFRQGFHRGAKGEISAVTHFMTAAHAKFMPV